MLAVLMPILIVTLNNHELRLLITSFRGQYENELVVAICSGAWGSAFSVRTKIKKTYLRSLFSVIMGKCGRVL